MPGDAEVPLDLPLRDLLGARSGASNEPGHRPGLFELCWVLRASRSTIRLSRLRQDRAGKGLRVELAATSTLSPRGILAASP